MSDVGSHAGFGPTEPWDEQRESEACEILGRLERLPRLVVNGVEYEHTDLPGYRRARDGTVMTSADLVPRSGVR